MIKVCNILPNNMINKNMPRQEYELYLTHKILDDPEKFAFLANDKENLISTYKILDNSACELGEGLDFDKVLKAAEIIGADEVVLPDQPRRSNSLSKTLEYLKDVPKDCPYKLAGVAQGATVEELIDCAEQLIGLKRIHTIMIPKWYCYADSSNGLGRHDITKEIITMMVDMDICKKIHWLGLDAGLRELVTPLVKYVRSVDTGYFTAMSTPQWSHLNVTSERPRDLKIDLESMDVDLNRWKKLVAEQKRILEEEIEDVQKGF